MRLAIPPRSCVPTLYREKSGLPRQPSRRGQSFGVVFGHGSRTAISADHQVCHWPLISAPRCRRICKSGGVSQLATHLTTAAWPPGRIVVLAAGPEIRRVRASMESAFTSTNVLVRKWRRHFSCSRATKTWADIKAVNLVAYVGSTGSKNGKLALLPLEKGQFSPVFLADSGRRPVLSLG